MSELKQTPKKKRFIAGAVCPECKQMDKIVMYPDEKRVECIQCEYEEIMDGEAEEVEPQLEQSKDTVSVVRFVEPS